METVMLTNMSSIENTSRHHRATHWKVEAMRSELDARWETVSTV